MNLSRLVLLLLPVFQTYGAQLMLALAAAGSRQASMMQHRSCTADVGGVSSSAIVCTMTLRLPLLGLIPAGAHTPPMQSLVDDLPVASLASTWLAGRAAGLC